MPTRRPAIELSALLLPWHPPELKLLVAATMFGQLRALNFGDVPDAGLAEIAMVANEMNAS